jgi:pyruvate dehydrogenase E2 component (dihydrolipoamide acetyltransferase)
LPERDFKLPDLGEGLTEAEVVRWLVHEGDTITLNQPIVEVETAKAMVEIPAPYAGTVVSLHAGEGDTVEVGMPLIRVSSGEPAAEAGDGGAQPARQAEEARQATLVGPGERQQLRRRRVAGHDGSRGPAQAPGGRAKPSVSPPVDNTAATEPATRPKATPPVRKYAKERGVDLERVDGSGKDGRITREDVERALAAAEPADVAGAEPAPAPGPARERTEQRVPVRGTRKQIATAMVASRFSIPHVTEFLTVDATALMALRDQLRALPAAAEIRVTPLAIIARAVCAALRQYPMMNSSWDEDASEIVVKGWVNLGIATDTDSGLLVPNVKDADTLGVLDLAAEIARVSTLARERRASVAELTGGTITITNVGGFGVETGTPIINKPECAIIATGLIAPRPWVVEGQLAVRQVMTASVSFDHRIVDGAYAARFLAHLRDLIEQPVLLAAF